METMTQVQAKERPILFSAPMVRATLEGRKTRTRRVVKPQHGFIRWNQVILDGYGGYTDEHGSPVICPYGRPGDRLWVRETHAWLDNGDDSGWIYRATDPDWETTQNWKWRPSIFMPRAASRILLEIADVRVERLQDITEEDATTEGIKYQSTDGFGYKWFGWEDKVQVTEKGEMISQNNHYDAFRSLWTSINGPESWEQNPWVWVIQFRKLEP